MDKKPEIQWCGLTAVVEHFPKSLDPYDMLWACENVEREGGDCYRFDNVYREDKQRFTEVIMGKRKHPRVTNPKDFGDE